MSIRTLTVAGGVSLALTILQVAWLSDRLVATDSTWHPIDIVITGIRVPFFPPWSSYLGAGFIFWLVYLWQGRR